MTNSHKGAPLPRMGVRDSRSSMMGPHRSTWPFLTQARADVMRASRGDAVLGPRQKPGHGAGDFIVVG